MAEAEGFKSGSNDTGVMRYDWAVGQGSANVRIQAEAEDKE